MSITFKELELCKCYLYKTAKGRYAGFVTYDPENQGRFASIDVILIHFQHEDTIEEAKFTVEDFKNGFVHTNSIFNGHTGINEDGLFMISLSRSDKEIIENFKLIGDIDLDPKKVQLGSGTGGIGKAIFDHYIFTISSSPYMNTTTKKPFRLFLK